MSGVGRLLDHMKRAGINKDVPVTELWVVTRRKSGKQPVPEEKTYNQLQRYVSAYASMVNAGKFQSSIPGRYYFITPGLMKRTYRLITAPYDN